MNLNRRQFLELSTGLAALSFFPTPPPRAKLDPKDVRWLKRAFARARSLGKPLLVLEVPPKTDQQWKHGGIFGDFLSLADDQTMAELSLAEVVCGGYEALDKLTGAWARVGGQQLSLIETNIADGKTPRSSGGYGWSMGKPLVKRGSHTLPSERQQQQIAQMHARRLGIIAHGALAKDAAMLERREAQLLKTVSRGAALRVFASILDGERPEAQVVDRVAPFLARRALDGDQEVKCLVSAHLARAARARLLDRAPPGAKWVQPSEGEPGPTGSLRYLRFGA